MVGRMDFGFLGDLASRSCKMERRSSATDSQSKSSTTTSLDWIRHTGALGCKALAQDDWLKEAIIASGPLIGLC